MRENDFSEKLAKEDTEEAKIVMIPEHGGELFVTPMSNGKGSNLRGQGQALTSEKGNLTGELIVKSFVCLQFLFSMLLCSLDAFHGVLLHWLRVSALFCVAVCFCDYCDSIACGLVRVFEVFLWHIVVLCVFLYIVLCIGVELSCLLHFECTCT